MPNDGKLLSKTRELLANTSETYLDIYSATGLTPTWLSLVANDKLKDPSVNKIQKLYEHLSGKELFN
jgi:hypothetical protein